MYKQSNKLLTNYSYRKRFSQENFRVWPTTFYCEI